MSANSNICSSSVSILIDWFFSLLWVIFFSFSECLVNFGWMLGIMSWLCWVLDMFYILINILELCPGMQSRYLESFFFFPFKSCFLKFVRQVLSCVSCRANYSPLLRQEPSEYYTQCLWFMRFSSSPDGFWHFSKSCVSSRNFFSNPFRYFSLLGSGSFLTYKQQSVS